MSVLSELKKAGGCAGGVAIYFAARELARIRNIQRKERKLWSSTREVMQQFFPKLNFREVEFCINSSLPGNWFESPDRVQATTFGTRMYFKGSNIQKSRAGLQLLMHELVHIDQIRRKGGENAFACAYGKGYLEAGSYRQNPLEVEAYDFVATHGNSLPDGVKKPELVTHVHYFPKCGGGKHHSSCAGKKAEHFCMKVMGAAYTCVHTK